MMSGIQPYQRLIFLVYLAFLVGFPLFSNGQISITAEEGFIPFKKIPYIFIKNRGISVPDTGRNVVWDYSHFLPCDNCAFITKFKPIKSGEPRGVDRYIPGQISILGFPLATEEYYGFNEEGDLYAMGYSHGAETIPLKRFSGHRLDKLKVEARNRQARILEYDFPFEYGKTWQTISADTVELLLHLPSVNLEEARLFDFSRDSIEQAIVGYGKLKIPHFEKGEKQVFTYDALLLKKTTWRSTRIEGDLSPKDLDYILGLAGLEQGYVSTCVSYKFYVKEMSLFVVYINDCADKESIDRIRLRTDLSEHPPQGD